MGNDNKNIKPLKFIKLDYSKLFSYLYQFNSVSSTNLLAKEIYKDFNDKNFVLLADTQSKGKGRGGNKWISPEGGIWISLVLQKEINKKDLSIIPLLVSIVIYNVLEPLNMNTIIKWPNDILINDKKVAGILTESLFSGKILKLLIIGIGINLNNKISDFEYTLSKSITTIYELTGKICDKKEFIHKILTEFENLYSILLFKGKDEIIKILKTKRTTIGRKVRFFNEKDEFYGTILDITPQGSIKIKSNEGKIKKFNFGSIDLIK